MSGRVIAQLREIGARDVEGARGFFRHSRFCWNGNRRAKAIPAESRMAKKPSRTFNIAGADFLRLRDSAQPQQDDRPGFFVQDRLTGFPKSYPTQVLAVAALCIAAYACCLNNGFISDDYENLRLAEGLKSDFWYLFKSPPLNFRMTSFLAYAMLDHLFAQHSEFFYTANIFLHFINCLLLWKLLLVLGRHAGEAYLAAILFAVFQAPQEGVMCIAAMNETLLGLFVLSTLVLWFRGHYLVSAIFLLLALFSTQSAAIAVLVIPLIRRQRGEKVLTPQMIPLLVPIFIFLAVFLWSLPANGMIQHGVYQVGPHAALVVGRTLHLLFRPSFY